MIREDTGHYGMKGNDIASSVMKLLEANLDNPRIKHIILWSDKCVPQNRNSFFPTAVNVFLKNHPQVLTIEHKFCEPGHSTIQEVDNMHSQIEQVCGNSEIYSLVELLRRVKMVHRRKPLKLIQLRSQDFHTIAQRGQYQSSKVKCLLFEQKKPKVIKYKTSF